MSRRALAALSAAALLVLTGCGDDDDATAEDKPSKIDGANCEYVDAGEPADFPTIMADAHRRLRKALCKGD